MRIPRREIIDTAWRALLGANSDAGLGNRALSVLSSRALVADEDRSAELDPRVLACIRKEGMSGTHA